MFEIIISCQLFIFILFIILYKRLIFSHGLLNITAFHFIYYFIFYYFGAAELYINGGMINDKYLFSVVFYPIISILGMYTTQIFQKNKVNFFVIKYWRFKYIFIGTISISILYFISLDTAPILYVLNGDGINAAISRSLATKEYSGPKLLYYFFRLIVDYILIYILIYIYIKKEKITKEFIFTLLISEFIALIDFQKYPAINIFLIVFVAIFLFNKKKNNIASLNISIFFNIKIFLLLLASYFLLGGLWSSAAGRLNDLDIYGKFVSIVENANIMIEDRLIYGENRPLYVVYSMIPDKVDYLSGMTFPNPFHLLPYEPIPLSYMVYDEIHPDGDGIPGVRGAAPTVYFSVIYANFGIVFSFLSMYFFGVVSQYINNKLISSNKYIIPYRYIWLNYFTLFATSIDVIYYSERLFILLFLYLFMYKKYPIVNN